MVNKYATWLNNNQRHEVKSKAEKPAEKVASPQPVKFQSSGEPDLTSMFARLSKSPDTLDAEQLIAKANQFREAAAVLLDTARQLEEVAAEIQMTAKPVKRAAPPSPRPPPPDPPPPTPPPSAPPPKPKKPVAPPDPPAPEPAPDAAQEEAKSPFVGALPPENPDGGGLKDDWDTMLPPAPVLRQSADPVPVSPPAPSLDDLWKFLGIDKSLLLPRSPAEPRNPSPPPQSPPPTKLIHDQDDEGNELVPQPNPPPRSKLILQPAVPAVADPPRSSPVEPPSPFAHPESSSQSQLSGNQMRLATSSSPSLSGTSPSQSPQNPPPQNPPQIPSPQRPPPQSPTRLPSSIQPPQKIQADVLRYLQKHRSPILPTPSLPPLSSEVLKMAAELKVSVTGMTEEQAQKQCLEAMDKLPPSPPPPPMNQPSSLPISPSPSKNQTPTPRHPGMDQDSPSPLSSEVLKLAADLEVDVTNLTEEQAQAKCREAMLPSLSP